MISAYAKPAPKPAAPTVKKPAGSPGANAGGLVPGLRTGDVSLLKYLSSLFGPSSSPDDLGKQASGYVSSQINPLIDNLTAEATKHLSAGSGALKSIYDEESSRLGGLSDTVRKDNAAATGLEERAGGGLRSYLEGIGSGAAGEVGSKLGAGAPDGSALANAATTAAAGVGGLGKGIAGESAARGYTGLSELNAHGAAAQRQADQLPGIATLEGLSGLRDFKDQVAGDLKGKTDSLLAQIPGMTASELQTLESNESSSRNSKASLLGSFLGGALDRNTQAAIAQAGLGKDATGAAIDWTSALGYKTDSNGNPVLDAGGNLIPTEKTVHDASTATGKNAKTHQKALVNLGKARDTAASTVRTLASKLAKAGISTQLQPVTPTIPSRLGKYKKQGGGFTNNPAEAEQKKGSVNVPAKSYGEIFKLALAQPEVQVLATRYGLKPAEVAKIVQQGLAAAGVSPPAAKPKTTAPAGPSIGSIVGDPFASGG